MSKEVIVCRKKGKGSEVFVDARRIFSSQEFAKPKDRIAQVEEDVVEGDEAKNGISGKIKPGSTQQRNRSITPKERKEGIMEAYTDGSYLSSGVDYTEHAEGEIYKEEVKSNPKYYKDEP